jgi:hypothetical protein
LTYPNKESYEGQWVEDKKHGNGFFNFNNGAKYQGIWENDQVLWKDSPYFK